MSTTRSTRSEDRRPSRTAGGRSSPAPGPRRDRLRRRLVPAVALAGVAFAVGIAVGANSGDNGRQAVESYAQAWSAGDWAGMHAQLTEEARRSTPLLAFAQLNRDALATATATEHSVRTGKPVKGDGDTWRVPVTVRTRAFGTVHGVVGVPVAKDGDDYRVAWAHRLVFPGLRDGDKLTRDTTMPARGSILARNGTALAKGPDRTSTIPDVAAQVVGKLGAIPPERAQELSALGVPSDAQVGTTGLERIFDAQLGGVPSGELKAGSRILASGRGRAGESVRTAIDPIVERATIAALAGRYGAAVAVKPNTGEVVAFAGAPFSLLQPPGSTFKIITAAAALEDGVATPKSTYEYQDKATLSGVPLSNAGGEVCGGTLAVAFAVSCNSVFAPLGAKLGAAKLVRAAEAFGFNQPAQIPGAAESTIPQAAQVGDDLAVGSTAIGQGRVQATTLQMLDAASTIANGGRRARLTLDLDQARRTTPGGGERVIPAKTARQMEQLMLGVVRNGTGTAAAIAGVPVAGKTGTAELKSRKPGDTTTNPEDTDAWFVAYAPAEKGRTPRAAVGVMLVGAGAGGDSAAPAARGMLVSMLSRPK